MNDEPVDEFVLTLQFLGGGLIGAVLVLAGVVHAFRRFWVS